MNAPDALTIALLAASAFFFLAGSVGMLRFPDTLSRLHALTKADNLGLGFVTAALMVQSGSVALALKLLAIWALVLIASSSACYLIAGHVHADRSGDDDDA
jgi:multicomponent Na+:H+ antiporter subunit G